MRLLVTINSFGRIGIEGTALGGVFVRAKLWQAQRGPKRCPTCTTLTTFWSHFQRNESSRKADTALLLQLLARITYGKAILDSPEPSFVHSSPNSQCTAVKSVSWRVIGLWA